VVLNRNPDWTNPLRDFRPLIVSIGRRGQLRRFLPESKRCDKKNYCSECEFHKTHLYTSGMYQMRACVKRANAIARLRCCGR